MFITRDSLPNKCRRVYTKFWEVERIEKISSLGERAQLSPKSREKRFKLFILHPHDHNTWHSVPHIAVTKDDRTIFTFRGIFLAAKKTYPLLTDWIGELIFDVFECWASIMAWAAPIEWQIEGLATGRGTCAPARKSSSASRKAFVDLCGRGRVLQ